MYREKEERIILIKRYIHSITSNESIYIGQKKRGLLRESNPGPLAPEASIIPLDQGAKYTTLDLVVKTLSYLYNIAVNIEVNEVSVAFKLIIHFG